MKIFSFVITGYLLLTVIRCLLKIVESYNELVSPLNPKSIVIDVARPYEICAISYFVFLLISVFLNIKKKYMANVVVSVSFVLVYFIITNFVLYG